MFEKLNIDKNIRNYEDMLITKKTNKENVLFLEQMIDKFRDQRSQIERKIHLLDSEIHKQAEREAGMGSHNITNNNYGSTQNNMPYVNESFLNQQENSQMQAGENNYGSRYYDPTAPYQRIGYRGHGVSPGGSPNQSNSPGQLINSNLNNVSILKPRNHDNSK